MNKNQIIIKFAEKMDISPAESRIYIDTLLDIILEGLIADEKVSFHEFCKIFVRSQSERIARNPKTGEEVMLIPRKTVRLKPSKHLIDKINNAD